MAAHDPLRLEHWRRLIDQWQASQLSINAFCRQRHLNTASFYRWRNILRQQPEPSPTHSQQQPARPHSQTLIPIRVIPDPTIDITLPSGLLLRVPLSADPHHLARLIHALGDSA